MLKTFNLLVFIAACFNGFAQNNYTTVHPSPNLGWNISEVLQNNNLATGTTSLSIPIYKLDVGKIEVPIALNYYNKAIHVDQYPGWTGLGWNLDAGGQISRKVNGKPDEIREARTITYNYYFVTNGYPDLASSTVDQIPTERNYGYEANRSYVAASNWNNSSYLSSLTNLNNVENSPIINFFSYDNGYFEVTSVPVYSFKAYDLEPDEFTFRVGNISGKFYLDHTGNWICQASTGNFKVEALYADNVGKGGPAAVLRMIYQFILTGPDGTKYYFGGNSSNKLQNLEFWRGPLGVGNNAVTTLGANLKLEICPNAWYVTRIESPENAYVDFEYEQGLPQETYSNAPFADYNNGSVSSTLAGYYHISMSEPWYLKKITASTGTLINFNSATSNQLSSDWDLEEPLGKNRYCSFKNYYDLLPLVIPGKNNLRKLNTIEINSNSLNVKTYKFDYVENLSERLKLSSFYETTAPGVTTNKYSFDYNPGLLPAYGSGKLDHFGYYNNNVPVFPPGMVYTKSNFESVYSASREPNFTYSLYETLKKVTFPTGGSRMYEYEQNDYASKATRWPFSISQNSPNKITGGIRVSKIIDYSSNTDIANTTEFIYKSDLTNNISSGILGVPDPVYTDGTENTFSFRTKGFVPLDRDEGNVAYSVVFEKFPDGSYKKYNFKTFDNGQNDAAGFSESAQPPFKDLNTFTNNSFRRGALKILSLYDNSNRLVKTTEFKYQDEFDNFSRYVRSIRVNQSNMGGVGGNGARYSAYPQYFFPNMIRNEKNEIVVAGTPNSIVTQTNYTYDSKNNLTFKETTNSKGEVKRVTYKYPYDYAISPYTDMVTRNMMNFVIEEAQTNTTLNKELSKTKNNYGFWQSNTLILPTTMQKSVLGNSLETQATINSYDTKGNILQTTSRNGIVTAFLWGYNQQFPVAKLIGITYNDALTQSSINTTVLNDLSATETAVKTELTKLRTLTNCQVITYTYKPVVGLLSETDINGRTTSYEYDKFNRLVTIRDQDNNVLKTFCYNQAGQVEKCCTNDLPDWQNTLTPLRCQMSGCSYTGYQEQEQKDINPCSGTYNNLKWVQVGGYNPLACPATTMVTVTYTNYNTPGFTAAYVNALTGQTYTFTIPATGSNAFLGCVPPATYYLTISKPGNTNPMYFNIGCRNATGSSVTFKAAVSTTTCNIVSISLAP